MNHKQIIIRGKKDITRKEYQTIMTDTLIKRTKALAGYMPSKSSKPVIYYDTRQTPSAELANGFHYGVSTEFPEATNWHERRRFVPYVPKLWQIKDRDMLPRINGVTSDFYHEMTYIPNVIGYIHKLIGNRGVIAGGAALYCHEDNHTRYKLRDIDVWTFNQADYESIKSDLMARNWHPDTRLFDFQRQYHTIDLHAPKFDNLHALLDDFDLSICKAYLDTDLRYIRSTEKSLRTIELRNLHSPLRLMRRLHKYHRRGFLLKDYLFNDLNHIDGALSARWEQVLIYTQELLQYYELNDELLGEIDYFLNGWDYEYDESGVYDDDDDDDDYIGYS